MALTEEDCKYYLWYMASLSPLADKRLQTEDFRFHLLVDEDTPDEQLYDILKSVLIDLKTMGVYFTENDLEIVDNNQSLDYFISLMKYLFPTSLFMLLRDSRILKQGIENIVGGNMTGSVFDAYLDFLYRYDEDLQPAIDYYRERFTGTLTFLDFLEGMLTHLADDSVSPLIPHEKVVVTHNFIEALETYTAKITEAGFLDKENTLLEDALRLVTMSCKNPEYLLKMGTWLLLRYNQLPDSYKPYYEKLTRAVLVTVPFSLDYYKDRGMDDPRTIEEKLICTLILGKASMKYSPTRYIKQFPEQTDFINKVSGVLADAES